MRPFTAESTNPTDPTGHKYFNKWTKFTLSSRLVNPLIKTVETLKPIMITELPLTFTTR